MQWYEEKSKPKSKSAISKIIIASIIFVIVMIVIIIGLIIYVLAKNKTQTLATIDGKSVSQISSLVKAQKNEEGETAVYIPIKQIAEYLGYKAYSGKYGEATEDENKCYVVSENEAATFTADSNVITKVDLTSSSKMENDYKIGANVIKKDDVFYVTADGIEKGFNVSFNYNVKNGQLQIFTLDYLVNFYQKQLAAGKYPVKSAKLYAEDFSNKKAILDDILIFKINEETQSTDESTAQSSVEGGYGAIKVANGETILETKYDSIKYNDYNSTFLVTFNKKVGLLNKEGKTLIKPEYDALSFIDNTHNFYLSKNNGLYGIVDGNGKTIIYPENQKLGISSDNFKYNGINNDYVLANRYIPAQQNNKWAIYNLEGKILSNGYIYDKVGCDVSGTNIYGLAVLPKYNYLVVQKDKKYSFMDEQGKDNILPFTFDSMYIRVSSGTASFNMTYQEKEYNIVKTLENRNN